MQNLASYREQHHRCGEKAVITSVEFEGITKNYVYTGIILIAWQYLFLLI